MIINMKLSLCFFLTMLATVAHAFAPSIERSRRDSALKLVIVNMPPAAEILNHAPVVSVSSSSAPQQQSALDAGTREYAAGATIQQQQLAPSSILLSLQERKPPTAEEIAQKKLTFNLWFWGGGIIAPFLATIFYFGFRFWEK
jgi:hypothetical protein